MFASFSLDSLIDDYGREYRVKRKTNEVEKVIAGIVHSPENDPWVCGFGAIVPLTFRDFNSDSEGAYTSEDKKCYSRENYEIGNQIKTQEDLEYTIMSKDNFSEFDNTNVFVYILKREGMKISSDRGFDHKQEIEF